MRILLYIKRPQQLYEMGRMERTAVKRGGTMGKEKASAGKRRSEAHGKGEERDLSWYYAGI